MVKFDNKRMIKHTTNRFFVFDNVLLLILADESLQHYFHGVKTAISQTSNKINLAKSTNS